MSYTVDKKFERISEKEKENMDGEFENCQFNQCDFSNQNFTNLKFIDCKFIDCNLSLINVHKTSFRDVEFINSKMLGVRFDLCNQFGLSLSFSNCLLNHSSFFGVKIKKTVFKKVELEEVDFTDADLTNCIFENCNLRNSKFENTVLEKADLSSSSYFEIDPEINSLKKAKFSLPQLPALLFKYKLEIVY